MRITVPSILPFLGVALMAIGVAHATDRAVEDGHNPTHAGAVEELAPTEVMVAAGSLYICPAPGYITEMYASDFTPLPTSSQELRLAVNAKLASAQRGKLGMKVDWCCPGKHAYEIPSSGWSWSPGKHISHYEVTITEVWCQ